jgi:DHA3 family macrolide efflux protein-like MFS transporter
VLRDTAEGLRILRQVKGMTALLAISAAYAFLYFPIGTLYPLMTMTYFGGGVAESGMVEILFAAGSLLGSLLLGWRGDKIHKMRAIRLSIAIYGAGVLVTGLLPPGGLKIFMALSLLMGASVPFYTGVQTAIFQMKIREEYLGRIFSLSSSVSMIAMPLGLSLSGSLVGRIGVEKWFLCSGIFTVLLAAVTLLIPSLRRCCENDENP